MVARHWSRANASGLTAARVFAFTARMRIAVVFAMEMEWSPWRTRHAFVASTTSSDAHDARARHDVFEATIGGSQVRVAICDVCAPRASASVAAAAGGHSPADALIVAGFGGGLRPAYRAGDIIVARCVHRGGRRDGDIGHDERNDGLAQCDAPFASDERLIAVAAACGATIVDSLVTINRVAATVEEKTRLGAAHDVVDMETARLFAEARALGVPALAIRVIGDPVDEPVPIELMRAMGPDHVVRPGRFAFEAARRPWRWPALARAFRTHDRARHQLAAFLDRLVHALDAREVPAEN